MLPNGFHQVTLMIADTLIMKASYRLYKRSNGMFYVHCNGTGKQTSLKTRNEAEARNLLASYNESANTAQANRVIGLAYISQSDPEAASRTWQLVFQQV